MTSDVSISTDAAWLSSFACSSISSDTIMLSIISTLDESSTWKCRELTVLVELLERVTTYFNKMLIATTPTAATKITLMIKLGEYVSAKSAEMPGTLAWPTPAPTTTARERLVVDGMYLCDVGSTMEVERPRTAELNHIRELRAAISALAVNCSDPTNITRLLTHDSRAPENMRCQGRTRVMRK